MALKRHIMRCKPLIINYSDSCIPMDCCIRVMHWSLILLPVSKETLLNRNTSQITYYNFIIDPNKLLYFHWHPEAFFPSVAFNSLAIFPKRWPLKRFSSPQVKFSCWNTVCLRARTSTSCSDVMMVQAKGIYILPAARVPTAAFLVLPTFYSWFYNSIETRYMFSIS